MSSNPPQDAAESRLRAGDRIDRYLLLRRLQGASPGRGRTFLALDRSGVELVVIQAEQASFGELSDFVQNYTSARAHADEAQPVVLSGGVEDGYAYLVSEWISGVSCEDLIRSGPTDSEVAAAIVWAAADSLARLHGRRRVHGDVHPENFRITSKGAFRFVGWLPAPLGRPLSGTDGQTKAQRYSAPEVAAGGALRRSSEVYSLGVMTYELLTGSRPLPAGTAAEVAEAQVEFAIKVDDPDRLHLRIPAALDGLLRGMAAEEVGARIPGGPQLVDEVLRAWPAVARKDELSDLLRAEFPRARQVAARRLLESVEEDLSEGRVLGAVAALRQLGTLRLPADDILLGRAQELLREVLWAFLEDPEREPSVVTFLAWRAGDALGARTEARLARALLAQVAAADDPLRLALPEDQEAAPAERERRAYVTHLREAPLDARSLLGLAIHAATPWDPEQPRQRQLADRLADAGHPAQALSVLASELARDEQDQGLLDRFRELASELHEGTAWVGTIEDFLGEPVVLEELSDAQDDEESLASQLLGSALGTAAERFDRGKELAESGDIAGAAELFTELLHAGDQEREHYVPRVCDQVRGMMWQVLAPASAGESSFRLMRSIVDLVRETGLHSLIHLAESLLLAHLPKDPGAAADALQRELDLDPRSLCLRQAAAVECLARGDEQGWARHLIVAAEALQDRGDLLTASKLVMAAREHLPVGETADALRGMFALAEKMGSLSQAFGTLQEDIRKLEPEEALAECQRFVTLNPGHRPAHELQIQLADAAGISDAATTGILELGRQALLQEDFGEAHRCFCLVLRAEPESEEAMLFLASLDPPEVVPGERPLETRIRLLRREGLPTVAMHWARRALREESRSLRLNRLLVDLCLDTGQDPAPFLAVVLTEAARVGDRTVARAIIEKTISSSPEPTFLVSLFLENPVFEELLARDDLMQMVIEARNSSR